MRSEGSLSRASLEARAVLRTHQRLAAGVAWGDSDFRPASASHDATVKVYDVRSSTALQSVAIGAKGTCVRRSFPLAHCPRSLGQGAM